MPPFQIENILFIISFAYGIHGYIIKTILKTSLCLEANRGRFP